MTQALREADLLLTKTWTGRLYTNARTDQSLPRQTSPNPHPRRWIVLDQRASRFTEVKGVGIQEVNRSYDGPDENSGEGFGGPGRPPVGSTRLKRLYGTSYRQIDTTESRMPCRRKGRR